MTNYYTVRKNKKFYAGIDRDYYRPVFSFFPKEAQLFLTKDEAQKEIEFLQRHFEELKNLKVSGTIRKYYQELVKE